MKKVLLMAAAFVAAAPVWAGWQLVNADDESTWHVDLAAMSVVGQKRQVWVLRNLNEPDSGGRSMRLLHEVDCRDQRYRLLQGQLYSGSMASGATLQAFNSPQSWKRAAAETIADDVVKTVCGLR